MSSPPRRTRLSIDVSVESRRRLRMAAARRDQSIRDYVWEAVAARLDRDTPPSGHAPAVGAVAGHPGTQMTPQSDPVLADLWMSTADAIYDDL